MKDPFTPGGAFDRWATQTPEEYFGTEDQEEFVLTCLLAETYDRKGRLINQSTLELTEYPQLTAKTDTGEYLMRRITFHFADGSELNITRHEP